MNRKRGPMKTKECGLTTLETRRLRGDQIEVCIDNYLVKAGYT